MANRFTGDYDAVLEVAPAGANRILAAIHRRGERTAQSAAGPHLPHSLWFNLPLAGATGAGPHGHLEVQVSTPSVDVAAGSSSRVTVSAEMRSWFRPAPGSAYAPEFLHGGVAITADVRVFKCQGKTFVEVGFGADGVQVDFSPAPGTLVTPEDVALVKAMALDVLRLGIGPAQLSIGTFAAGGFAVRDLGFKTLRSGSSAALAALLKLREGGPAPSPAAVTEVFVAGDDAAIALGREFFRGVLFDLAQGALGGIEVGGSHFVGGWGIGFTVSFEARVDPASLDAELQAGRLRARIDGSGSLSPGGSFRFRLTQHFGLSAVGGELRLALEGDPELEVTQGNWFLHFVLFLVRGMVEGRIRDAAVVLAGAANEELNRVVDESVGGLLAELALPAAALGFTRAAIDPDGILLGGRFDIGPGPAPVASFTDELVQPAGGGPGLPTPQRELSAFKSWIPGGTVERYRWKQVSITGTVVEQFDDLHRFVARPQPTAFEGGWDSALAAAVTIGWPAVFWCLEVHGRQLAGTGTQSVSATNCGLTVAVASVDVTAGEQLTVEVPDGHGGVLADVDPWGGFRPHVFARDEEERGYLLVHRVGGEEGVKALRDVLAGRARTAAAVLPLLVVEGRAAERARAVREAPELVSTRDGTGAWRKRFRLERAGATVLVGPGGREVWRAAALEADELRRALAGLPSKQPRRPRRRSVALGLDLGALAPDVVFTCALDGLVATRKLRGREIVIAFWTSWSEPALEELRRLAAAPSPGAGQGPVVLCVNDGEPRDVAQRALKERGLDLLLVADPDRALARRYGVSCWPTVVRVDRQGRIAGVRFGLEHDFAQAAPAGR